MRRTAVAALLSALSLVLAAGPAYASCLFDDRPLAERLAEQPLVFVGTTTEIQSDGRAAQFAVEEVWHGETGASVIVWGGSPAAPGGVATSIDRTFVPGERYLVAARSEGGSWVSDSCMPTEPWDEATHAQARPADVTAPRTDVDDTTAASEDGGTIVPAAVATALAIGGLGAYALYRRRRAS